jgi:hypothetical protein
MHGVSHVFLSQGFERFGFKPFIPVKEQQSPDPEFPTVKFPNPEEAGMYPTSIPNDGTDYDPVLGALVTRKSQIGGMVLKCKKRILPFVRQRQRARLMFSRKILTQIGFLLQRESKVLHGIVWLGLLKNVRFS